MKDVDRGGVTQELSRRYQLDCNTGCYPGGVSIKGDHNGQQKVTKEKYYQKMSTEGKREFTKEGH